MDFTLEQLRSGNWEAWDTAYKYFFQFILNFYSCAEAFVRQQDREDVAAQAVVKLMGCIEGITSPKHLKNSAYEIARSTRVDFIRRATADKRGGGEVETVSMDDPDSVKEVSAIVAHDHPQDDTAASVEESTIIKMALMEIDEPGRSVIALSLNGLEQHEIADNLGLNVKTIGSYKSRALMKLSKILARRNNL